MTIQERYKKKELLALSRWLDSHWEGDSSAPFYFVSDYIKKKNTVEYGGDCPVYTLYRGSQKVAVVESKTFRLWFDNHMEEYKTYQRVFIKKRRDKYRKPKLKAIKHKKPEWNPFKIISDKRFDFNLKLIGQYLASANRGDHTRKLNKESSFDFVSINIMVQSYQRGY